MKALRWFRTLLNYMQAAQFALHFGAPLDPNLFRSVDLRRRHPIFYTLGVPEIW